MLRLIAAWQEERRTRPLVPGAVATLVVPIPPASAHAPSDGASTGIPQTVAEMLRSVNEALSAATHSLTQVAPAVRDALTEADTQTERRLGEALAATTAAAEAALAAERERFAAERTLLEDSANVRMAEAARFAGDAADMMEELEAKEADTLEHMAALESQIAVAGAEAATQQRRIDELLGELVDIWRTT
ncbi:hypothetical protein GAY28_11955 [Azospirillum brasilense]|nr:hypothetical protein [Azospirillum brasilense]